MLIKPVIEDCKRFKEDFLLSSTAQQRSELMKHLIGFVGICWLVMFGFILATLPIWILLLWIFKY